MLKVSLCFEKVFNLSYSTWNFPNITHINVFAIYDTKEHFLKKGKGTHTVVKDKKAVAYFKNLKKGDYAVSLFHDENDNKIMDTKIFGIPKEPYGFSNDATGFMGPPKFKDAKFNLDTDKTITIRVD